jgi:hypothetical protein
MSSFVTTDSQGNFILDGKPWFLHGAVYFGRRPGTCGADWMGENFQHNLSFLDQDIETMHQMGLNTIGLFVPSYNFFDGLKPVQERFDQLAYLLDRIKQGGIRAVVFDLWTVTKENWCAINGIDPGDELWHPAIHPEAERAFIESKRILRSPFADRTEIIGWATGGSRFFEFKFTVPPVRRTWYAWLRKRFDWDFARVKELFNLEDNEYDWERVRMPTEMEPYFSHDNPRSYEFALMQQVLNQHSANRLVRAVRPFTPHHLLFDGMEGCCFSTGHLTHSIPEEVEADGLWTEYYHWEGLRSYAYMNEPNKFWMPEPAANKPSVEILNAAGYVQMLTRWMKHSKKALIICHGVDIGDKRRGVRNEEDQTYMLSRYDTFYLESGGNGISYWCWNDDELSKTFTKQFGVEFSSDTDESLKKYIQAGETMGLVRYDGTPRPVTEKIRQVSDQMAGKPAKIPPDEVLVLLPAPVFQSLYRYRANLTSFGVFTSLGRQGILANMAFTSAGEKLLTLDDIVKYRLVILGASSYKRDYPEIPVVLLDYVQNGGTLFLPLAQCDTLIDPYLKVRSSATLKSLAGCKSCEVVEQGRLSIIKGLHPAFSDNLPDSWELVMDEPAFFTRVQLKPEAEILAQANNYPLLYRHKIGKGTVYVYTWNLDVFIYEGKTIDHYSDKWDWMWKGIATETGLEQRLDSPVRETILQMMG